MIKNIPIKDLKRAEYNPRIMADSEMESLMKSIQEHGFIEPIVVNGTKERYGVLIGGHQRLTAIERLIAKGFIPANIEKVKEDYVIPAMLVDLDLEHEKTLNIGLNRIHGKFDEIKLYQLVVELKESPILPTSGLRDDEISRILDRGMIMGDEEEETGEGLPDEPISKIGEVYDLGPHRLICGDSTDPEVYEKLLGKEQADMIWTDPPYNVAYKSQSESKLAKDGKQSIMNDDLDPKVFAELIDNSFAAMFRRVRIGGALYICTGWQSYAQFIQSMLKNGLYHSGVIVWVKPNASMGWSDYHKKYEWISKSKKPDNKTAQSIIYGWKEGTHTFFGENEFDVWEMPRKAVNNYLHPTEKPDWLPMRAIRNSTKRGDIVLDPFSGSGSGSVMSACDKTGRRAFMIELDPKFCDVIRDRYTRMNAPKKEEDDKK